MFQSVALSTRSTPETAVFAHFSEKGAGLALDPKSKARAAALGLLDCINDALRRPEATGAPGVVVEAFPASGRKQPFTRVLVVGVGEKACFCGAGLRTLGAAAGRRLAAAKSESVQFELDGVLDACKIDHAEAGSCLGEALGLLAWTCDEFRGKATTPAKRVKLVVRATDSLAQGLARGLGLAESANLARTLSQTPPNVATPEWMAAQAQRMARKTGLRCRIFAGDELVRERCEGLINVGKASENKPRLIRLEYTPRGGGRGKPVVLVGKTMTYDTGGLSLKVNNGMVGMKRDKDGGCAVLGAMHAIATVIRPRKRVIAYLVSAENSVSDEAYRPDDVLRFRNNVTVEVTNTDAEGRLVLADGLCIACEKDNPGAIIDLATLTGGVVVALGSTYAGMFCEDDKLREKVERASARSGERVWRLPMHQEYRDMMKSPVADIINSNPNREAHPIQGAAFLSYFVDENVPWCHLDIAGVHAVKGPKGMFNEGPTGWGVRLLAELLDAE